MTGGMAAVESLVPPRDGRDHPGPRDPACSCTAYCMCRTGSDWSDDPCKTASQGCLTSCFGGMVVSRWDASP